jgi:hypothetical protein
MVFIWWREPDTRRIHVTTCDNELQADVIAKLLVAKSIAWSTSLMELLISGR